MTGRLPYGEIALALNGRGRPAAFAALAQANRLEIFRRLLADVPTGATSADIAKRLSLRHNVVSSQLRLLVRAGLVTVRHERGSVRFHARLDSLHSLFDFGVDA
jgi:DNA-binding transcriptional ArsR family regulator